MCVIQHRPNQQKPFIALWLPPSNVKTSKLLSPIINKTSWKNLSPGTFKLFTVPADEKKVMQRAEPKENEPLTQTLVPTNFTFVPALTELLNLELRWLRDFIMCRVSQIHTESRSMASEGATPHSHHFCSFMFFFLFPSKWGYSFAPLMSAAALTLADPRVLWTLPNGRRRKNV